MIRPRRTTGRREHIRDTVLRLPSRIKAKAQGNSATKPGAAPARWSRWAWLSAVAAAGTAAGAAISGRARNLTGRAGTTPPSPDAPGLTARLTGSARTVTEDTATRLLHLGAAGRRRVGAAGSAAWRELRRPADSPPITGASVAQAPPAAAPEPGSTTVPESTEATGTSSNTRG
jgi:hypothetical protein